MALIRCPDCGNEVSDAAPSCPKCGRPSNPVQTIEKTGKRFKGQMLVAVGLVIFGPITCMAGAGGESTTGAGIGMLMFFGGLVLFIATRVRTWWHHG